MAGQLDNLFKNVAKSVVSQLGASLDYDITYTKKASPSYNTSTGALTTTDTSYSITVPISFIRSEEETGQEMRQARLYITPDLIGQYRNDKDYRKRLQSWLNERWSEKDQLMQEMTHDS